MSNDAAQLFFALLALIAATGTLGVLVAWATGRRDALGALAPVALTMAWLVATTATAGSLYISEVIGYQPCRLCWYQRFAMYPLVVIIGVAAIARRRSLAVSGAVLAVIGGGISTYHVLIQRFPSLEGSSCAAELPCNAIWIEEFGFLTIPTMALIGFITIIAMTAVWLTNRQEVAT